MVFLLLYLSNYLMFVSRNRSEIFGHTALVLHPADIWDYTQVSPSGQTVLASSNAKTHQQVYRLQRLVYNYNANVSTIITTCLRLQRQVHNYYSNMTMITATVQRLQQLVHELNNASAITVTFTRLQQHVRDHSNMYTIITSTCLQEENHSIKHLRNI